MKEYLARRRSRQNSASSNYIDNPNLMRTVTGGSGDKELRGVQLHPVALVDDFNPNASKAGV